MPTAHTRNLRGAGRYVGDRGDKRIVRTFFYARAAEIIGSDFKSTYHLVLGGTGGDIDALLSLGVPSHLIQVAEWDPEVCLALKRRYDVPIYQEDIVTTATRICDKRIGSINLDFCGNLRQELINRVTAIARILPTAPIIGVTLAGSRERDNSMRCRIDEKAKLFPTSAPAHYRSEVLTDSLFSTQLGLVSGASLSYASSTASPSMVTKLYYRGTVNRVNYFPETHLKASSVNEVDVALRMRQLGFSATHIAPLLSHPRQRVAKWFADDTRRKRLAKTNQNAA